MRRVMGVVALVAAGAAVPAQAACWSQDEVSAAQVRDMQTMLMVAALRCRANGRDILADYNGFVRANRASLEAGNDRIKARFRADWGPVDGQKRYDSFTTQLANAYGSAESDAAACDGASALARRAAAVADAAGLAGLAHDAVFATPIPDKVCQLPVMADAAAAAPAPVVLAAVSDVATAAANPAVVLAAAPAEAGTPQGR